MTITLTLSHLYIALMLIAGCLIGLCLLHLDCRINRQERLIQHLIEREMYQVKESKKEVK